MLLMFDTTFNEATDCIVKNLEIIFFWANHHKQKCIQDPHNHLRWGFLQQIINDF